MLATKFDLTISISETAGSIRGEIAYKADLFDATTITRMAGHYRQLLESLVSEPDRSVFDIRILDDVEMHQLQVAWNDTVREFPFDICLHHRFEAQVDRTPDSIATVYGDEHSSYWHLNQGANVLALELRGLGVRPEELVAICLDRSVELVEGLLGILKSGAAYLPLDPSSPAERLSFMLEDSSVRVVLTRPEYAGNLPSIGIQRVDVNRAIAGLEETQISNPSRCGMPEQLAYVIYTSGSTGKPKGVLIEHRQVTNYYFGIWERLRLQERPNFALVQPLTVDSSVTVIYAALMWGGCLHLIPTELALDPDHLADYFERHQIECLKIAPSHLAALINSEGRAGRLLPQRHLVIGGEASHWEFVEDLAIDADCDIYNHYGPTETTVGVLTYLVTTNVRAAQQTATVPLGHPLGNTTVYVVDRSQQLQPAGVAGELYVGGRAAGRGYLKRTELTAGRFLPDPFACEPGSRVYSTGDIVRSLASGDLEFLGRLDDQVKVRGYRIELGEVEAAVRAQPGIKEALVAVHEEKRGVNRLVCYVVGDGQFPLLVAEVQRRVKERLPEYMVPTAFVKLDRMPLTPH
ncbi:MAG: non-ribosomal peptide synthetase, partial [Blastocatellia bacterium]